MNGFPLIIMPYMKKGDLHQYLSNNEIKLKISWIQLLEFARQVAEGMNEQI